MNLRDDLSVALIQWPHLVLGVGATFADAQASARKQVHPKVSAHVPQITRGVRAGDIRWATISQDDAARVGPGDEVRLDMLHSRPGHILVWASDETEQGWDD